MHTIQHGMRVSIHAILNPCGNRGGCAACAEKRWRTFGYRQKSKRTSIFIDDSVLMAIEFDTHGLGKPLHEFGRKLEPLGSSQNCRLLIHLSVVIPTGNSSKLEVPQEQNDQQGVFSEGIL